MKHIINAIVENQPGVLARIVGLFSGRGYNIDTLNVGPCADPMLSRMTITVLGDDHVLEQVIKQLNKQVDIVKVLDLTSLRHLERELILVEIGAPRNKRPEIMDIATLFRAEIIGVRENSLTMQYIGTQEQIDDFLAMIRPYSIMDLSRSGVLAVSRGGE
ncbi:MAG: acetolactate synthase small subunit [Kiritimatiellae bacterium]|nr:acetolactate synthase small subunit [Kiritimatiellia bacterium]MBO7298644.1 acetolactate synthase small subunit [Kiritimatiellia bacterium]